MNKFDRRTFMKQSAFTCAAGLVPMSPLAFGQDKGHKLNILLLVSEDHAPNLGCYGDRMARTPNLDRFAGEGVRFNNAYVTAASCSPSRATMLTGLFPQQHGQIGLSMSYSTKEKLVSMKSGIVTIPQLLKKSGYTTGILGKIHVDPHEELGFDFVRGSESMGESRQSQMELPVIDQNGEQLTRPVRYSADVDQMTRDAITFFAESNDRPFFLMVNFSDAHQPWHNQINGYSMRTERYRYTEWQDIQSRAIMGRELYNHEKDPQENVNTGDLSQNAEFVEKLSRQLNAGYKAALPT